MENQTMNEQYQDQQQPNNQSPNLNAGNLGGMDASELVKTLISNAHVPVEVAERFWGFFSQSTKLTFLDRQVIQSKMRRFESERLTVLESMPKGAYTPAIEETLFFIREEYENNLYRSLGHFQNQIELLHQSTTVNYTDRNVPVQNSHKPGWFSNLLNGITGGKTA